MLDCWLWALLLTNCITLGHWEIACPSFSRLGGERHGGAKKKSVTD